MVKLDERIGIFICHCGFNIGGVLDIKRIMAHFSRKDAYPDVIIKDHEYWCSDAGLVKMKADIKELGLSRIIIAACTMKLHGELFKGVAEEMGINRFLVEFANIREQNSWVHAGQPVEATDKAIDQVDMAIRKVRLAMALDVTTSPVTRAALVIGGGVAGIKAALALGDAGIKTWLVERQPSIGGHMALFDKTFPTLDCSICVLGPEMVHVKEHPNITLLTYADIEAVTGFAGNFTARVRKKARYIDEQKCAGCFNDCCDVCPVDVDEPYYPRHAIHVPYPQAVPLIPIIDATYCIHCKACELGCRRGAIKFDQQDEIVDIQAGAIIVATGYEAFDPSAKQEFGYGRYPDVITGMEMERLLNPHGPTGGAVIVPSSGKRPASIAYILCVGARDDKSGNPWCSRACCNYSIKQSIQIKERVPGARVEVFYTDLRATGKGCEEFLNRARSEFAIRFTRGKASRITRADGSNTLIIEAEDTLVQRRVEREFDLVVLATSMVPPRDARDVAKILNISTGPDGFYLEDHLKMRPAMSTLRGIFLAGVAQGPKDIPESIAHAESAASKVIGMIAKGFIDIDPRKIHHDPATCIKCKLCTQICNFGALEFKNDQIEVTLPNCTGCGACQAMCPTGALSIPGFTKGEVLSQIDAATTNKRISPLIIAFLCNWCSYAGADLAGTAKLQYPPNARVIHVMCSAMVDPLYVFTAFARGADGVLVAGCYEQDCHYATGFAKTRARAEAISIILEKMGISPGRFVVESISAAEGRKFKETIEALVSRLMAS